MKNKKVVNIEGLMKSFPEGIKFKYDWRKYQQRVLDQLEKHLDNNQLHVIAPPGSGKTILGLEVVLRLNKPTLVFAPTISIRNQWMDHFRDLFLQQENTPDWISKDLRNPKFLTVSTYQALHAICSGIDVDTEVSEEENEVVENNVESSEAKTEALIALLKANNFGTIVLDEAHHLKNAWWQSLMHVKDALNPTMVSLTATPPYDVSHLEWQRYMELNGPVDAEISVPELVVEGDLCPHQDYIYFCHPTEGESQEIGIFRQRIQSLFEEIKVDQTLLEAMEQHPVFKEPKAHLDWIYTNLEYYSSLLIFLNCSGKKISPDHLEVIGDTNVSLPVLNYEWVEILLTFYLYKDPANFSAYKVHHDSLLNKLKRSGAIERRSINFRYHKKINSFLSSSLGKLKSINKIIDFEYGQLGHELRMVVLTDYIRKEFLVDKAENNLELNKIGVLPIFEQIRRDNNKNIKIGILTGEIVVIPLSAYESFQELLTKNGIRNFSGTALPYDSNYLLIHSTSQIKEVIVQVITHIFQEGHIEVLVGTKSLLGEGWDAPAINSLVLASFVGSYVLSNQMRGRAIRTQRKNIDKTGNIWHLVCVDPTSGDGGDDFQFLRRRFKSFVGVSLREDVSIENGIGRMMLPDSIRDTTELNAINNKMLLSAGNRNGLKEEWRKALEKGALLIEEIKVPFSEDKDYQQEKSLNYDKTIKYLMYTLGSALLGFSFQVFQGLGKVARHIRTIDDLINWLLVIVVIGVAFFGRLTLKTFRVYVQYRDIYKDINQIGNALLESLINVEAVNTARSQLTVISDVDKWGAIYCHLDGGTTYEKSIFIKALQEVIGTVENPRYLIIRKSVFLHVISQKDFHSVPENIGSKKQLALYFEEQWKKYVGDCELIFTRTIEGRKLLLKSRINSLASEFENKTERINKWR